MVNNLGKHIIGRPRTRKKEHGNTIFPQSTTDAVMTRCEGLLDATVAVIPKVDGDSTPLVKGRFASCPWSNKRLSASVRLEHIQPGSTPGRLTLFLVLERVLVWVLGVPLPWRYLAEPVMGISTILWQTS